MQTWRNLKPSSAQVRELFRFLLIHNLKIKKIMISAENKILLLVTRKLPPRHHASLSPYDESSTAIRSVHRRVGLSFGACASNCRQLRQRQRQQRKCACGGYFPAAASRRRTLAESGDA